MIFGLTIALFCSIVKTGKLIPRLTLGITLSKQSESKAKTKKLTKLRLASGEQSRLSLSVIESGQSIALDGKRYKVIF